MKKVKSTFFFIEMRVPNRCKRTTKIWLSFYIIESSLWSAISSPIFFGDSDPPQRHPEFVMLGWKAGSATCGPFSCIAMDFFCVWNLGCYFCWFVSLVLLLFLFHLISCCSCCSWFFFYDLCLFHCFLLHCSRIYGVFSLDCVIQTLRLMTGRCFVDEAVSPKMLDMMRHLTEELTYLCHLTVFFSLLVPQNSLCSLPFALLCTLNFS